MLKRNYPYLRLTSQAIKGNYCECLGHVHGKKSGREEYDEYKKWKKVFKEKKE